MSGKYVQVAPDLGPIALDRFPAHNVSHIHGTTTACLCGSSYVLPMVWADS